jgi:hypothetical protein
VWCFILRGKPVPDIERKQIIYLYEQGRSLCNIATAVGTTEPTVGNIIHRHLDTGDYTPRTQTARRQNVKRTLDVLKTIEYYKFAKPSIYLKEIQQHLVTDGVCTVDTVPSIQYLSKILKESLLYTHKKLTVVPMESQSPDIQLKYDMFLDFISNSEPNSIHFFDESSVVQNSGNRKYGHSTINQRAIELQKYTSRATFTVNLLHSIHGIDYYNIIKGASNGLEMLQFFSDALTATDANGIQKLSPGDVVVMDNCGFHHAHNTEPQLRLMLAQRHITLVFQPPYHPQLNTCEYCFHQLKTFLRQHETYTEQLTEMAISDGLLERVTTAFSRNIFSHCGYI